MTRAKPLSQLLPGVAGVPASLAICGLVQDSRDVRAGDAFVAIGGFGTHGLHFVEQAKAAGASAILFEPPVPADVPAPPADAIAVPRLRASMGAMAHGYPGRAGVGVDLNVTHLLAVRSGHVHGTATALHLGRNVVTYAVEVRDDAGRLTATGRLTCHMIDLPSTGR